MYHLSVNLVNLLPLCSKRFKLKQAWNVGSQIIVKILKINA